MIKLRAGYVFIQVLSANITPFLKNSSSRAVISWNKRDAVRAFLWSSFSLELQKLN
jgi:hypothetical protein